MTPNPTMTPPVTVDLTKKATPPVASSPVAPSPVAKDGKRGWRAFGRRRGDARRPSPVTVKAPPSPQPKPVKPKPVKTAGDKATPVKATAVKFLKRRPRRDAPVTGERRPRQQVALVATLTATAAAINIVLTAIAFWLSYQHLQTIAASHGLADDPARAWAWPAIIDLFIVLGELLILVASLNGRVAVWGIGLTVAGSGASIALNAAGVGPEGDSLDYVVAVAPPIAALLAFGALMNQVHKLLNRVAERGDTVTAVVERLAGVTDPHPSVPVTATPATATAPPVKTTPVKPEATPAKATGDAPDVTPVKTTSAAKVTTPPATPVIPEPRPVTATPAKGDAPANDGDAQGGPVTYTNPVEAAIRPLYDTGTRPVTSQMTAAMTAAGLKSSDSTARMARKRIEEREPHLAKLPAALGTKTA